MASVEARGVSQAYGGVRVLDQVDITVEAGRIHILAGENGAGKSTLVKILTGVENPVEGEVLIDGRPARSEPALFDKIAYVPQELSLFQNLTVAENLFIPFGKHQAGGGFLSRRSLERDAQRYIDEFHIHAAPSQLVSESSVSDQQLIQIARAVSRDDARILILDEPTSSLTQFECERLFKVLRRLAAEGAGIVFISHKMEEIFELGDTYSVLRNGKLIDCGAMSALSEPELIRLMAGEAVATEQAFRPSEAGDDVILKVEGLSGKGFTGIDFSLRRGEILGFGGLVGAGRSDLMQAVFGFRRPRAGRVLLNGSEIRPGRPSDAARAGLYYLSEERSLHGIFPQMSLHDNIALTLFGQTARAGFVSGRAERGAVDAIIERYAIRTSSRDKLIRHLSGGNQQKAIIGRAIARQPDVLIFDEPTKGIDVRTKLQIYQLIRDLAAEGIGIIMVSSDMQELMKCASRIMTMREGRLVGTFDPQRSDKSEIIASMLGSRQAEHAHS